MRSHQGVDLGADVCCLCFGLVGTLDVTTASRLYDRFGHACMYDVCWPCQFTEWMQVRFRDSTRRVRRGHTPK